MTGVPTIRPMVDADLREVMAIDESVYVSTWSAAFWKQQLSLGPRRVLLVAEHDGTVVGHAVLMVLADEGHVASVAVHPDRQGQGVGRALVAGLCRAGIEAGCQALTLEVRVSNESALALYRRFGFAPAGIRPNYYADTGEDALVMWVHDITGDEFASRLELAGTGA